MTIRRLIYFSDRAAGLLGTISSSTVNAAIEKAYGVPAPAQDEREAQQCLFVLRSIGSMDAEDISGDDVDLRFEDGEGRDTGCDISIVEYAERSADLIERLLARPAQTEQQPVAHRECRVIGFRPGMGEVTFYVEGGVPQWMNIGETIYVSDAAPIAQTAEDTKRLEWMIAERCIIESQNGTGSPTVYRVAWPSLGEAQSEWYPTEREAIDHAQGGRHE